MIFFSYFGVGGGVCMVVWSIGTIFTSAPEVVFYDICTINGSSSFFFEAWNLSVIYYISIAVVRRLYYKMSSNLPWISNKISSETRSRGIFWCSIGQGLIALITQYTHSNRRWQSSHVDFRNLYGGCEKRALSPEGQGSSMMVRLYNGS